jgi:predicted TIM-barrel fold metal-dependent hydrolase
MQRADSHIHLFRNGYQGGSLMKQLGSRVDEMAAYDSLTREHNIQRALVVGYAGEPWCRDNNSYLEQIVDQHDWIAPAAYVDPSQPCTIDQLQQWAMQGFVGIAIYIFDDTTGDYVGNFDDTIWAWLAQRQWLISVNSTGKHWKIWQDILQRHPTLRLVVSHLGLPPKHSTAPSLETAKEILRDVTALAAFTGPRIKLSGFYAMTDPGHDYPHTAACPYVQVLADHFGTDRLLWGSDFSPHLDWLGFPQTFDLFGHMPFLTDNDRRQIEGDNLLTLLHEIQR